MPHFMSQLYSENIEILTPYENFNFLGVPLKSVFGGYLANDASYTPLNCIFRVSHRISRLLVYIIPHFKFHLFLKKRDILTHYENFNFLGVPLKSVFGGYLANDAS